MKPSFLKVRMISKSRQTPKVMIRLVFASSNQHKTNEIRNMLPEGYELLNLADIGCTEEIPETAETIEGMRY
jgi:inosine/xanthosine triphosphate pyrophosphatase family protein